MFIRLQRHPTVTTLASSVIRIRSTSLMVEHFLKAFNQQNNLIDWIRPVVLFHWSDYTLSCTQEVETLDYVSCFPLHFVRALAASYVLYYKTEHIRICWICFDLFASVFTDVHLPNKSRFWCLKNILSPIPLSHYSNGKNDEEQSYKHLQVIRQLEF